MQLLILFATSIREANATLTSLPLSPSSCSSDGESSLSDMVNRRPGNEALWREYLHERRIDMKGAWFHSILHHLLTCTSVNQAEEFTVELAKHSQCL